VRSYGWLAVALTAALTACSGGHGAGGAVVPAAEQLQNAPAASSSERVVECHLGGGGGTSGGGGSGGSGSESLSLCRGTTGVIDGVTDGDPIVAASSGNVRVATVTADLARDRSQPTVNREPASWFDVAAVDAGVTVITLRDSKGHTGTVTVTVTNCATPTPAPTATPTPTPAPTATPTPAPTATPTPAPTATPTPAPTATPTPQPTATPSPTPTPNPLCPSSSQRKTSGKSRGTRTGTIGLC